MPRYRQHDPHETAGMVLVYVLMLAVAAFALYKLAQAYGY